MTNLLFEIEIHSGGQFERNPELVYLGGKVSTYCKIDPNRLSYFEIQDMIAECGSPSTSMVYYLIPGGNLEQGLRLITGDDEVLYMSELHVAWPIDRITLYVEGSVEPLQVVGLDGVVGQSDFGGVVDEGDELEGDELNEGDEGDVFEGDELNELVSYDWMNDGLEGADFADDIFGGNENEDDNEVMGNEGNNSQPEVGGNGGNNASDAQPSMQPEIESNGGNNASDAQPSMQPEVGSNGGNNAQLGVGSNEGNNAQSEVGNNRQPEVRNNAQPEVGNNAQPAMGIDRIRLGIEDYEIHTGAISDDEDPRNRPPEFNQQTDMRKPDFVLSIKFPNSRVFREALREYVVNKTVDIKFKLNEKTKISVHCKNDCGWRLYASVIPGELTFKIKTFQSVCTCGKSFQHSQVSSSYVARKYLQDFGKNPKWEVAGVQHHGRFGGQLLAATARDGNDNIFPVAIAVVEQEFIDFNALFVLRDLYLHLRNYSQKLNIAASTEREFERRMKYLKGALSGYLVNNISKSFNAMILPARDKPILSMLEWIRVRLMTRLHIKRIGMEKHGGSVCPNVQDKLEKLKMESRSFSTMPSGRFKYEVDNYYERHVVDLTKKECTCRIWDLTETLVHNIPPTVLIVGTRSPIHRKIEVRKHLTRLHAPVRRTTFPQALPPATASWMLRSSHHHHGRNLRHHIFHLTKFGDHLTGVFFPQSQNNYNCGFHATCPLLDLRTKSIVVAMPPRALSYIKTYQDIPL
uniref:Uncharacterized protein n=1 Tax=Fagus sylvatica TaxID=28930 RepID=A0A2N9HEE9_FAGSY